MDEPDWEYEHELALLEEDLKLIADRLRADETKKMVNAIEVGQSIPRTDRADESQAERQAAVAGTCRVCAQSTVTGHVGCGPLDIPGSRFLSGGAVFDQGEESVSSD